MSRARPGFTVIESCVAAALLAAALALAVVMLASVARQRQAAGRHARTVLAADNLLARLSSEPYESLTSKRAAEICQESQAGEVLDETSATVEVSAGTSPPGKKITVAIDWRAGGQGPPARHRVVTWVFEPEVKP